MRVKLFWKYCFVVLLVGLSFPACEKHPRVRHLTLYNPLMIERPDEAFVIKRESLGYTNELLLPVIKNEKGIYISSQIDDLDNDGKWDEAAFVYTLLPQERVHLIIDWVPVNDFPDFPLRTNIRFGKMNFLSGRIESPETDIHGKYNLPRGEGYPYQMDGPAWENDKMGFRHYFDGRNCRDVFGKRVPDMVLDTVGIRPDGTPGDTYHVMADWGRDIMSAANSFGLGGLAIQLPDTLLRLGVEIQDTIDNVDSTRYTLITKGPVRSVLRLDFYGWEVERTKVNVQADVTIWAGKYGYENVIRTDSLPDHTFLVTGIVTNNNEKELIKETYGGKTVAMMTHDKQTYNKEWYMGMGLLIPSSNLKNTFRAPIQGNGIINTWCAALCPDEKNEYRYNTYAVWEKSDERFKDREEFIKLMEQYALSLNVPVQVELK